MSARGPIVDSNVHLWDPWENPVFCENRTTGPFQDKVVSSHVMTATGRADARSA